MKWLPFVPLVLIIIIGEIAVGSGFVADYLIPRPSSVFMALSIDSAELWSAALKTLLCSLAGLALSALVGTALGVLFSSHRLIEEALYPYAIFFQTVPIIAVAPLLVIWIGFGAPTVVASAFIVSIFPMIASTLTGLKSVDPALLDLFTMLRASSWARLSKLKFPSALPHIFVGLRIAAGLSVIGAIVGEFIAGGGLGGFIDTARTRQRVDLIFAAVGVASLIGLSFVSLMNLLIRRCTFAKFPA